MIDNFEGLYTLECDICGQEANESFDSFYEAVEYKKDRSNGWHSRKENGEWLDICPDCQGGRP
jgi:hypothetical protein